MSEVYQIWNYEHLRRKHNIITNPIILKFNLERKLIDSELPEQTPQPQLTEPYSGLIEHCLSLPPIDAEEEYLSQIMNESGAYL